MDKEEEEEYVCAQYLGEGWCPLDTSVYEHLFHLAWLICPIDKDDPNTEYDLGLDGILIGGKKDPKTGRIYFPKNKLNKFIDEFLQKEIAEQDHRRVVYRELEKLKELL